MESVRSGNLNGTFDGEGAKRKKPQKTGSPKGRPKPKRIRTKTLKPNESLKEDVESTNIDLSGCVKTLKRKNAEGCYGTKYA